MEHYQANSFGFCSALGDTQSAMVVARHSQGPSSPKDFDGLNVFKAGSCNKPQIFACQNAFDTMLTFPGVLARAQSNRAFEQMPSVVDIPLDFRQSSKGLLY